MMPTPISDPDKARRWREANAEFASFEVRVHNLANNIVRCVRRIHYARANAKVADKRSLRMREIGRAEMWADRLKAYQAELADLIHEAEQ